MKMRENDARGRKRRKISKLYIFHEKKHENESCAVFRADIGGPDGKKPVKIAPAGPGRTGNPWPRLEGCLPLATA